MSCEPRPLVVTRGPLREERPVPLLFVGFNYSSLRRPCLPPSPKPSWELLGLRHYISHLIMGALGGASSAFAHDTAFTTSDWR